MEAFSDGSILQRKQTPKKSVATNLKIGMNVSLQYVTVNQGGSGHGAQTGRETETEYFSRLEPGVPIHPVSPNPPRLTRTKIAILMASYSRLPPVIVVKVYESI